MKNILLFFAVFLDFVIRSASAHDISSQRFSVEKIKTAVQNFSSCVKSERAVFDENKKICGVDAENRTELRSYLVCPNRKHYIFSRRLEVDTQQGRFLYTCAGRPDIVIALVFDRGQLVVTGIGELLP